MSDSITRIGLIFIIYLFIAVITFFVMSTPMELLFDGFDDADFGDAENEKDQLMGNYRVVFTFAMALMLSIPVTYLIFKIFSRDPNYYRYRRF